MGTLKETKIGETVKVKKLGGSGALRQHFLDMGNQPDRPGKGCQRRRRTPTAFP